MIKIIVIALVVLIVGLLVFAATKPDTFRVERTASIKAQPKKIFPLITNLHKWGDWSPWEKMDPAMKRTFSGPEAGIGSAYAWEGNNKVGKGRMEIMEVSPSFRVVIKLDFEKPLEGHSIAEFTLQPQGDVTNVTWAMYGSNSYLAKVMSIFFGMDKMIGKDFETGLANLKILAEK